MSEPGDLRLPGSESISNARRRVAQELASVGIEGAGDEGRRLLEAALGMSGAELLSRSGEELGAEQTARIGLFLQRRLKHEPLSRIVGIREFYGRSFKVTPATLDPRADTETLIDAAREVFADARDRALRMLDIGTGTGAIMVTLLAEFPNARGVATDISSDALAVARENAQSHGVFERIVIVETDLAAGVEGQFDLVVSNPPYIPSGDIADLGRSVKEFDPHIALDGGADGLSVYRRIADLLPFLSPDGTVLLEVGFNQADAVAGILETAFARAAIPIKIRFYTDVAGIRRVVAARARSAGYAEKPLGFSKPGE